jgi:hypothetical protein
MKPIDPRLPEALTWRNQGLTFREMGEIWGVSHGRAGQIYAKAIRMAQHPLRDPHTLEYLPHRADWQDENYEKYLKMVASDPSKRIKIISSGP